jgi:DNA-binding XRE family transcriptional regulator
MSKKPISFREQMDLARPDVVERQKRNIRKSAIALQLRTLRDSKGMSQADVSEATGMTEHCIARLESLVGPLPSIVDLERFVSACDGKVDVVISPNESDG